MRIDLNPRQMDTVIKALDVTGNEDLMNLILDRLEEEIEQDRREEVA